MTNIDDDASSLFQRGSDLARSGNYAEAIELFDRVVAADPDLAEAYGHRCVARYRTGNRQGAIADCNRAAILDLEQGNVQSYEYAIGMLAKLEELATAL